MASNNVQLFTQTDGTTAIDTILTQEANRIGSDIHRRTLHTTPWMDLLKQTAFPSGMGYQLGTLVYDRALPRTTATSTSLGLNWTALGTNPQDTLRTDSTVDQVFIGAPDTNIGPNVAAGKSFISFARQLKQYSLSRAVVESPRINVEDLRFAAYRQEQLRAVMDALTEATRYSWEERYRDEYDRVCANLVPCLQSGTPVVQTYDLDNAVAPLKIEGRQTVDVDLISDFTVSGTDNDYRPTANISNKILDTIYFRLVRSGAGANAYGRENARPVFALVCSSEASYKLISESGIRDDYRYNNAKVGELIAPLGIERSHRGFYHLVDDLAPRFNVAGTGILTRVFPYSATAAGVISENAGYNTATLEAAYVLHQDVMESQIPEPITGSNGLTFDPVTYRGKFDWKNIANENTNPDGTIGFFRGVLASATKPIKTEFGYVLLFDRTSANAAA
jgi:hypothetical protein